MRSLRLLLSTFFILSLAFLSAQTPSPRNPGSFPPPLPVSPRIESKKEFKNFRGTRLTDLSGEFTLVGIKIFLCDEKMIVDLFFNQEINPYTVKSECIKASCESQYAKKDYLFTKNTRGLRYYFDKYDFITDYPIKDEKNLFTIDINGIQSMNGLVMKQEHFPEVSINTEYYKTKENGEWRKY